MKLLLALMILCPVFSSAEIYRRYSLPRGMNVEALQKTLESEKFAVSHFFTENSKVFLVLQPNEKKDPLPIIESMASAGQRNLRILAGKLKDRSITPAEKDELLLLLVLEFLDAS